MNVYLNRYSLFFGPRAQPVARMPFETGALERCPGASDYAWEEAGWEAAEYFPGRVVKGRTVMTETGLEAQWLAVIGRPDAQTLPVYEVDLNAVGNPDFRQYRDIAPRMQARGATLDDICASCRAYIRAFDLGGGNWGGPWTDDEDMQRGGMVYRVDELGDRQHIGSVLYCGRYWTIEEEQEFERELKEKYG